MGGAIIRYCFAPVCDNPAPAVPGAVDTADRITAKLLHELVRSRARASDGQSAAPAAIDDVFAARRILEVRSFSVRGVLEIDGDLAGLGIDNDDLPRRAFDGEVALVWREGRIGGMREGMGAH